MDGGGATQRTADAAKAAAPKAVEHRDEAALVCQDCAQFLRYGARRIIRRRLRDWLKSNGLSTMELLHHAEHATRLDNSGTVLQSAVQRIAVAQVQTTGDSVHERQNVLFRLCDEHLRKVREIWRQKAVPSIEPKNLSLALDAAMARDDGIFLFNAALADFIRPLKTRADKVRALTALLADNPHDGTGATLDMFIANFLEDADTLGELLGEHPNAGAALVYLADLARGALPDTERNGGAPELPLIGAAIAAGGLPYVRHALFRRIVRSLAGTRLLCGDDLAAECTLFAALESRLRRADGEWEGGHQVEDAVHERIGRLLNADAIARHLFEDKRPLERAARLLALEQGVIGKANKRRLAEFLEPILQSGEADPPDPDDTRAHIADAKGWAALYRQLKKSGFAPHHRDRLLQQTDQRCVNSLTTGEVFDVFERRNDDPVNCGMIVLRLLADGAFSPGQARTLAVARLRRLLRRPEVLARLLERAAEDPANKPALIALQDILATSKA